MVFQNILLPEILLTLVSLKCLSLVWWSNLTQKFLCFMYVSQFSLDLFLLELLLALILRIIAFMRDLVIKTLLKRRTFTLTGAILFRVSRKTTWKLENLSVNLV